MIMNKLICSWYALHTRSKFENKVYDALIKKSIEVFFPKVQVRSKRRDRKVMLNVPLFPGYMFIKTDLNPCEYIEIIRTVGAVRLIGNKDSPVSISSESIESLKIIVAQNNPIITGIRFKRGDRVIVVYGPFAGVTGIFDRYEKKGRVLVYIEALGQFAGVNVSKKDVEILS